MLINQETTTYLAKAVEAIELGRGDIPLSDTCPECGLRCNTYLRAHDDCHVVMKVSGDVYAILIGCEGYWCIDPELIGLPRGNWQPNALGNYGVGLINPAD